MPLGRLGKYERVDVLGHGVSGIVYLAWDTLLKKQVALKVVDLQTGDVERFLEEARVLDRLNHPNIVHVNGVDQIDGNVCIDMEYVQGANLQEVLRREGRLSIDRALHIAAQVLDALDYAHRLRTVHRDIKPANILIHRSGTVKLVDFGLAEVLSTNSYAGGAGTYAYMAPEDLDETRHSDHQSDLWAVGVTLYEMLTGARPFNVARAHDPFAWRRAVTEEHPAPLSEHMSNATIALQAVIDHALAPDKAARYADASSFRDDLIAVRQCKPPTHALEAFTPEHTAVANHTTAASRNHPVPPNTTWHPTPASTGGGVAVATVAETVVPPAPRSRGLSSLLHRRPVAPAVVHADPEYVDFGAIRMGDSEATRLSVAFQGGSGKMEGRVTSCPACLNVRPTRLDRRRQMVRVTIDTSDAAGPGDIEEVVRFDTSAGPLAVPIRARVLPARPRFDQVALWFVPVFWSVLLPSVTVAWYSADPKARYLVPAAALSSDLLAAMLLMVSSAADLGVGERWASAVLMLVMTTVLGAAIGSAHGSASVLVPMLAVAIPIGTAALLHTFSKRLWKLWACMLTLLGLLASVGFVAVLNGR